MAIALNYASLVYYLFAHVRQEPDAIPKQGPLFPFKKNAFRFLKLEKPSKLHSIKKVLNELDYSSFTSYCKKS